jgi:NAD(P)-dependent dehydrogenase (short-subunit alcohol dehydrogenase family)
MHGRLHDRIAIVTGSSQGIGREICHEFSVEGALLVCANLRPDCQGDQIPTHEWIIKEGGQAIFVPTDVSIASSWEELVKKTVETYGRLDMYVFVMETSIRSLLTKRSVW